MNYQIDPQHSAAQFKVRHMMIANVKGEFDRVKGTVEFDPANLAATKINAAVDVASISTREPDRDNHLKSPDFFDVEKYPEITFNSTQVQTDGDGYKVTGDLTIHGVTKPITLEVESVSPEMKDPWGLLRRGLTATAHINRKDFGMVFNMPLDGGGWVVGDKVDITLDVEMTRAAQ
ncbi:MAG: YceI family protein [Bryobacterales bacterium]|nr:YceI family protein [Bryobacterales bacterium]MBV9400322.1 YceI family protein [Bryobacterales bacterium]